VYKFYNVLSDFYISDFKINNSFDRKQSYTPKEENKSLMIFNYICLI